MKLFCAVCTIYFFCKFYIEETNVALFGMFVNASDEEVVTLLGMERHA
jgi:hypothetical protein